MKYVDEFRDPEKAQFLLKEIRTLVPQIQAILAWLGTRPGANFVRMSGSGATCFALFDSEDGRDAAAVAVPREWWRLATFLR